MHEKIKKFIHKQRLLSLAVKDDEGVYVANLFYVFDENNLSLIFASEAQTQHIVLAQQNQNVAFSIAKDSKIALLQGLQAKALFQKADEAQKTLYVKSFPMALLSKAEFYTLKILWAKFTDNALKKKLYFP